MLDWPLSWVSGRVLTEAPTWAVDMVARAWSIEGQQDRPCPVLTWRVRNGRSGSSGRTFDLDGSDPLNITVRAGTDAIEQRIIVTHEVAHAITRAGHTPKFWACAWRLYTGFGLIAYRAVFMSEFKYKAGAIKGAFKAGVAIPDGVIAEARPNWVHDHEWTHDSKRSRKDRDVWRCWCTSLLIERFISAAGRS